MRWRDLSPTTRERIVAFLTILHQDDRNFYKPQCFNPEQDQRLSAFILRKREAIMFKVKGSLALAFTSILLTLVGAQVTTQAQQRQEVAPAPVPEQILSATKVFIANAPGDISTTELMKLYDDINRPYSEFYTGMRNWGKFILVSAPSNADLIFAIRYKYKALQIRLVILDPQTRVPLWWFSENAGGGGSKNTRQKDLQKGVNGLISDVKRLYTASPAQNTLR